MGPSRTTQRLHHDALCEGWDEEEGIIPGLESRALQFWPETITDTVNVNYVDKSVPGGSHPIKQWVSNGGRSISFTVLIARDIKPNQHLGLTGLVVDPQSDTNAPFNHDVRQDIAFLRSFCYPTYEKSDGITLAKPPPFAFITAEGLGWGQYGLDWFIGVMTNCTVNYLRTFNEGFPRMATVDLTFAEIANAGGTVVFHDRIDFMDGPFFETADAET